MMQNNHRSGRSGSSRSRRSRWNDEGTSHTNRTSRSHQNNYRRTRNNNYSHRNQYPYNTYSRNQVTQQDSQNAYNYSRQQYYYPPGATARSNDNYGNSWFPSYSPDAPWDTSNHQYRNNNNPRVWYYPPEAAWGTSQQANGYQRTQFYSPSNQNDWRNYENANTTASNHSPNGNRSWNSENLSLGNQPFWWEDSSEATSFCHEYFWMPNTGGEIQCIVCRRNYTTVTDSGENVMSSACGHLFCTGCLNSNDSSFNCRICNIRVSDLWRIFM